MRIYIRTNWGTYMSSLRITILERHDYQRMIRFHVPMLFAMLWKYKLVVILTNIDSIHQKSLDVFYTLQRQASFTRHWQRPHVPCCASNHLSPLWSETGNRWIRPGHWGSDPLQNARATLWGRARLRGRGIVAKRPRDSRGSVQRDSRGSARRQILHCWRIQWTTGTWDLWFPSHGACHLIFFQLPPTVPVYQICFMCLWSSRGVRALCTSTVSNLEKGVFDSFTLRCCHLSATCWSRKRSVTVIKLMRACVCVWNPSRHLCFTVYHVAPYSHWLLKTMLCLGPGK